MNPAFEDALKLAINRSYIDIRKLDMPCVESCRNRKKMETHIHSVLNQPGQASTKFKIVTATNAKLHIASQLEYNFLPMQILESIVLFWNEDRQFYYLEFCQHYIMISFCSDSFLYLCSAPLHTSIYYLFIAWIQNSVGCVPIKKTPQYISILHNLIQAKHGFLVNRKGLFFWLALRIKSNFTK